MTPSPKPVSAAVPLTPAVSPVAVLDTNVLVSALCLPQSLPAQLLRRWLARQFVLVLSETILAELADVLARPKIVRRFAITPDKARAFASVLRDLAVIVSGSLTLRAVPGDPKDDHVVACAVEGGADAIVSGDRHLQEMGQYGGGQYAAIRVLSPAQFLAALREAWGEAQAEGAPEE